MAEPETTTQPKTRDEWLQYLKTKNSIWVEHYFYLRDHGYLLRPRYHPDWIPTWINEDGSFKIDKEYEDFHSPVRRNVLDATRLQDGSQVVLKIVGWEELHRMLYFSTMDASPRNHCVPLLDHILVPDDKISAEFMVMLKLRNFSDAPLFHCRAEVIECLRQIIEGISFLHEKNFAHCDACTYNFLVDPTHICPEGFHFAAPWSVDGIRSDLPTVPRCKVPICYYIIDFEYTHAFPEGREEALLGKRTCEIHTAPEIAMENIACNPFALDVYNIGATFLELCDEQNGLDDLRPLLQRLTDEVPGRRPTIEAAAKELEKFVEEMGPDWACTLLPKKVY